MELEFFPKKRANAIFFRHFWDFAVNHVRYDWFCASMRRQMILHPSLPALRDRRGAPELDYLITRLKSSEIVIEISQLNVKQIRKAIVFTRVPVVNR